MIFFILSLYSTSQFELSMLPWSRWLWAATWDRRGLAGEENVQANRYDIVYLVLRQHASPCCIAAHGRWRQHRQNLEVPLVHIELMLMVMQGMGTNLQLERKP